MYNNSSSKRRSFFLDASKYLNVKCHNIKCRIQLRPTFKIAQQWPFDVVDIETCNKAIESLMNRRYRDE